MPKNKSNIHAVETVTEQASTEQVAAVEAPVAGPNYRLEYRRDHPGGGALGRCSYGIAGVSGIVVFDKSLFVGGVAPASITCDCEFVQPKLDAKQAKVEAAAVKAADRAAKQQARLEAQTAKAVERQAKADAKLAEAKAKIEAAQAKAAPVKAAEVAAV